MGGLNPITKIKETGVDVTKRTVAAVALRDIWFPPEGHPLHHPRRNHALDESMVIDIMQNGIKLPILVRRDGADPETGKTRLTLIDGARRVSHGEEAERRLGSVIRVNLEFFEGDDKAALRERLLRNDDPLKKPDSLGVLARTFIQMDKLGMSSKEILECAPRHVTKFNLPNLLRWPSLLPEVAARFDAGEGKISFLAEILDAPREEQASALDALVQGKAPEKRERTWRPTAKALGRVETAVNLSKPDGDLATGFLLGIGLARGDRSALDELPAALRKVVEEVLNG